MAKFLVYLVIKRFSKGNRTFEILYPFFHFFRYLCDNPAEIRSALSAVSYLSSALWSYVARISAIRQHLTPAVPPPPHYNSDTVASGIEITSTRIAK